MKKLILLLLVWCCFNNLLHAQVAIAKSEETVKDAVSRLKALSTNRIIEKVYLHFNKPYYNAGDTIYYKAYVTAGEGHDLSKISGVLHVDLISKNDSVMQSEILQLKAGLAWGDFALSAYISKGNYRIRAYTRWMQNEGSDWFFNKVIPVNGSNIAKVVSTKANDNNVSIQFFPEGGALVTAIPSRVAFKAVSGNGIGAYVKGTVIDNNNKEVTHFASAHLGMGQLFITPETGKTYKAKVTLPDGSVNTIDLPQPLEKGIALTVNNSDLEKLSIDINANKPYYLENKNKEISVVIYSAGIVKTVKTVLDNQEIGFDLPKKDLKTGIAQITVFAANGIPLSERLVFIQNQADLNLIVNSDKAIYANHEKAKVALNAALADSKTSTGSFSVAVVNENKVLTNEDSESSILSDMLLTSELRGYVEQPGYYFNNVTADTRNNLDILMLTQGYRRFEWKKLLNESPAIVAFKPEGGIDISGLLLTNAGKPVPNEKVSLMLASTMQSVNAVTDASGKFIFPGVEFADGTRFLLNTDNKALRSKAKIVLDNANILLPVNALTEPKQPDINLPEYTGAFNANIGTDKRDLLNVINVKEPAKRQYGITGVSNADQIIYRKDILAAPSLSQGLVSIARNIDFIQGRAYIRNNAMTSSLTGASREPMMIVVDGAITQNGNIDVFLPADIDNIQILKGANASAYGMGAGAGVILINTRHGGSDEGIVSKQMSPGILSITPKGFYVAREFYSPVYDVTRNLPLGDRSTIYWQPNLTTNTAGNATFEYFNNGAGKYRIIVEGIDSMGNIGRVVYKYTVR